MDIDVRIISSTNEIPRDAIDNGHLREDLFYRLSVVQISIPPLEDRKEDIPCWCSILLPNIMKDFIKNVLGVDHEVLDYFMKFPWPGNVRQLKACGISDELCC